MKGGKGVAADVTVNGGDFHEHDEYTESPSKVVVAKEAAELEKLQNRLSVRDLATEFESGQAVAKAAAAKLAEEEKTCSPAKEAKDSKRRSSGGHQCRHSHGHGHSHGNSPGETATKSPGEGSPFFRTSLRRTSGNIRECEKHKVQEVVVLDRPALTKKLRTLLSEIALRVAGRNKDDATEALSIVNAIELQWAQKEKELAQERADVRKMASLFKQASDDARRMVDEARKNAQAEVDAARGTVLRVEAALEDQAESLSIAEKEELEGMRKVINEARRIKMLHEPSKAMDMEFEIEGLRKQLSQKTVELINTRKELVAAKRAGQTGDYEVQGEERLGAALTVAQINEKATDLGKCAVQWHRLSVDGSKGGPITGEQSTSAIRINLTGLDLLLSSNRRRMVGEVLDIETPQPRSSLVVQMSSKDFESLTVIRLPMSLSRATRLHYAPDPLDVGWLLRAELSLPDGKKESIFTTGALDAAPGLGNYVEALFKKGGAQFNARLVQQNGDILEKPSLHVLLIDQTRIKLSRGRTIKAKEEYSSILQLCGARGGGQAAVRALYWVANKNLSLMLVLESERERNAAILLARRFARDQNVALLGPDDAISANHS